MNNTTGIVTTARNAMAARRAQRQRRDQLAHELAAFSTESDRLELDMIISRYPDEQTREIRAILDRQWALAA